jgi:sporulation protein YlmC with PRC-barrel domain
LTQSQKEVSESKGKLIGKYVIDQEGNLVGKVRDVCFTAGKQGVSLIVEDKDGATQEIAWDIIQGAADYVVLKPSSQARAAALSASQTQQQYTLPSQTVQTAQSTSPSQPLCPICGQLLTWIPQYKRWYCYKDQRYA